MLHGERLNIDLMALCEEVSSHETVRSEFRDAQDANSQIEAPSMSSCEHVKATESHLAQVAQQYNVAQAKLVR